VSVASFTETEANRAAALFHQPHFRWCVHFGTVKHRITEIPATLAEIPLALNFQGLSRTYMLLLLVCQMVSGSKITQGLVSAIWRVHRNAPQIPYVVIITRGLAEMTCIGTAFGASPLTFLGLAGVGDLFLTCSSSNSRNYTVGYRLGKNESLDEITKTLGSVAEGVSTTKGVKTIVDELGVFAPIASSVSGQ
jgi:hypothetical protein